MCIDVSDSESEDEWNHWISLRLLTHCHCTQTPCTDCRDEWQWADGSNSAGFYNLTGSQPAPNITCAYMGIINDGIYWLSQNCSFAFQVFCEKGTCLVLIATEQ